MNKMEEDKSFHPEPCISLTILNALSFRTAINMINDVRCGCMEIRFYRNKMVIEEFSEDERTFCKVIIKKKNLYHYSFSPEVSEIYNEKNTCFSVTINTNEFIESIKCDNKQRFVFEIFCCTSGYDCAICFARNRSGGSVDTIFGTFDFIPKSNKKIDDPYKLVYNEMEANSIMTEKELADQLAMFKNKKYQKTSFMLLSDETIRIEASKGRKVTNADLLKNLSRRYEESEDSSITNFYEVSLNFEQISDLLKICKLGQNNIIEVYMSLDYPLFFRAKLMNYGTFSLWYLGD